MMLSVYYLFAFNTYLLLVPRGVSRPSDPRVIAIAIKGDLPRTSLSGPVASFDSVTEIQ